MMLVGFEALRLIYEAHVPIQYRVGAAVVVSFVWAYLLPAQDIMPINKPTQPETWEVPEQRWICN
jgi:hypothetical protein